MKKVQAPICPYCGKTSVLVGGLIIYPHRQDLAGKRFFNCAPCQAYVGCHQDTGEPFGRLADAELRKAKMAAHAAFDPLWRSKRMSRNTAYQRLSVAMGISQEETHIGMFDLERCKQVVKLVKAGALDRDNRVQRGA